MTDKLDNSVIIEPGASLVVAHAQLCETLRNAKIVVDNGLKTYNSRKADLIKDTSATAGECTQLLWIVVPVLQNILEILESVEI